MAVPAKMRRRSRFLVIASLLPTLLLASCGSKREVDLAQQVAAAEAAADRAETAKLAAETAVASLANGAAGSDFNEDEEVIEEVDGVDSD